MTAEEMLYRAEVSYDFITGFSAEGITKKEWSLFFTEAQLDIVKKKLPVSGSDISFEDNELVSIQFIEIVTEAVDQLGNYTTKISVDQTGGVNSNSVFFDIPDDFMYGVLEKVSYVNPDCSGKKTQKIITTNFATLAENLKIDIAGIDLDKGFINSVISKHDEIISYDIDSDKYSYYIDTIEYPMFNIKPINNSYYTINIHNPFKKPSYELGWRLKAKSSNNTKRHEIITERRVKDYYLKYIKVPSPIIVFDADYNGDNDTIQGVTLNSVFTNGSSMHCVLNDAICDTIINRAVMIAQKSLGDVQSYQVSGADASTLN